jgi:TetR/AcrR family transcriptional repressor of nem operon
MARPRKFDEAEVKSALRDVFWEHGYEGASYADIMKATGLNKGSLYASFGDKRALYQHAISDYNTQYVTVGVKMLRNSSLSVEERISNLFASHIEAAQTPQGRWGCLLCNAAIDQAPFDKDVEDNVSASISRLRSAIKHCVKGSSAQDKADLIWISYFGAHVMVKAGYSKSVFKKVQKDVLTLF